jgi:hypothetical protein
MPIAVLPNASLPLVPENVGVAIKALAAGHAAAEQQMLAYTFMVNELSGKNDITLALACSVEVSNWVAGRRWFGRRLEQIVSEPVKFAEPSPPRPRTMIEAGEQRRHREANGL